MNFFARVSGIPQVCGRFQFDDLGQLRAGAAFEEMADCGTRLAGSVPGQRTILRGRGGPSACGRLELRRRWGA